MPASDERIEVGFGVNLGELQSGISQAMSTIGQLQNVASQVTTAFASLAAIFAGGRLFSDAINQAVNFSDELTQMTRVMGISMSSAATLRESLSAIGFSTESYQMIAQRMTMRLRENETRFNSLGVVTRDAGNNLLNTNEIIQNTIKALENFKEGTDRNLAATELFGRNWANVSRLIDMTPDVMKRAKKSVEDLNATMAGPTREQILAYKEAQSDVHTVLETLANTISSFIMPQLIELARYFVESGPAAIRVMRVAIASLEIIFVGFKTSVVLAWDVIKGVIQSMAVSLLAVAEAARLVFVEHDWEGAKAAWNRGGEQIRDIVKNTWDEMVKDAEESGKKIDEAMLFGAGFDPYKTAAKKPPKASGEKKFTPDKDKELAKLYDLEQAKLAVSLAAAKNDLEEKVRLTAAWAERVKGWYGIDSVQYQGALKQKLEAELALQDQLTSLKDEEIKRDTERQMASMELERDKANYRVKIGELTEMQLLDIEKNINNREYAMQQEAAKKRQALYDGDKEKKRAVANELGKIEDKYQKDQQKNTQAVTLAIKQQWQTILSGITSAFSTSIKGIIMGTTTLRDALRNIFQSILLSFIDMAMKNLEEWIATELAKKGISLTIAGILKAIGIASTIETAVASKAGAAAVIPTDAAEAAAGAYAATAVIPYVGPFLAPAAAAEAYAAVMALMPVAAAEGGYDVPGDTLALLHKQEMVLPADLAEKVRGSTGGAVNLHFHGEVIDGASVQQFWDKHGRNIARTLGKQSRNFMRPKNV